MITSVLDAKVDIILTRIINVNCYPLTVYKLTQKEYVQNVPQVIIWIQTVFVKYFLMIVSKLTNTDHVHNVIKVIKSIQKVNAKRNLLFVLNILILIVMEKSHPNIVGLVLKYVRNVQVVTTWIKAVNANKCLKTVCK